MGKNTITLIVRAKENDTLNHHLLEQTLIARANEHDKLNHDTSWNLGIPNLHDKSYVMRKPVFWHMRITKVMTSWTSNNFQICNCLLVLRHSAGNSLLFLFALGRAECLYNSCKICQIFQEAWTESVRCRLYFLVLCINDFILGSLENSVTRAELLVAYIVV